MEVTLRYFDGCPNWKTTLDHLNKLAEEIPNMHISKYRVETSEDAERIAFHGSPSILVDDIDIFDSSNTPVGLACRVYQTPNGLEGSPTIDQLREMLSK